MNQNNIGSQAVQVSVNWGDEVVGLALYLSFGNENANKSLKLCWVACMCDAIGGLEIVVGTRWIRVADVKCKGISADYSIMYVAVKEVAKN